MNACEANTAYDVIPTADDCIWPRIHSTLLNVNEPCRDMSVRWLALKYAPAQSFSVLMAENTQPRS